MVCNCSSSFMEHIYLQDEDPIYIEFLAGLLVITAVCILLTNISVIYAIVSLKLQDNPSMRLKLILCSSDIVVGTSILEYFAQIIIYI